MRIAKAGRAKWQNAKKPIFVYKSLQYGPVDYTGRYMGLVGTSFKPYMLVVPVHQLADLKATQFRVVSKGGYLI